MFPELSSSYQDELGTVSPQVLKEAAHIWPSARNFAQKLLNNEEDGQLLMMKAIVNVSGKWSEDTSEIKNLRAYLFSSFRRLVLAKIREERLHHELEERWLNHLNEVFQNTPRKEEEKIYQQILITELEERMDDWTRKVFQYRILGYEYRDLVPHFGSAENVIRSKFSKKLKSLAAEFQE